MENKLEGRCNHPDRDVAGLICGYPLPCPHHTVVADIGKTPPEISVNVCTSAIGHMDKISEVVNALADQGWVKISDRWGNTHNIEKVFGTEVDLTKLKPNQSVCYGDGKTYFFLLTEK